MNKKHGGERPNAGHPQKYKKGTETKTIAVLIPSVLEIEVKDAIHVIVEPYLLSKEKSSAV